MNRLSRLGITIYINGLIAALIAAVAAIAGATALGLALVSYLNAVGVL
jgi:hypothetical protein